jgi:hypothetical protein
MTNIKYAKTSHTYYDFVIDKLNIPEVKYASRKKMFNIIRTMWKEHKAAKELVIDSSDASSASTTSAVDDA